MKFRTEYLIPPAAGTVIAFVPLIGNLHVDSALLASLAGCFWAGWRACDRNLRRGGDIAGAARICGYMLLAGLPLLAGDLIGNCFSFDGLAFWLIYPVPSVFFGYGVGRLMRLSGMPWPRFLTVAVLLFLALGVTAYELFSYPQVYFFNHVWGGWPGPIYDESVQVSGSALRFRSLTFFWILLLWNLPLVKRSKRSTATALLSVAVLSAGYTQLNEMGILTSRSYLQEVLGGHEETEHFRIYYDRHSYSEEEVAQLAAEHEFYLDRITRILRVDKPEADAKIESYLYAHPWQKKKLTGAKFTSYVPVWLKRDQLHIARGQLESSLEHELVHVVAKSFGNRLFNASWSAGMIEGLAVAVTGGSSLHTTIDQIVVSEKPYPASDELRHIFSPLGFYGGRPGVNYTTSGSFIRFLLNEYPPENLKRAYRSGTVTEAYDTGWKILTAKWHGVLDTVAVDSVDRQVAGRILGIPSLFEQACPRVQTHFARAWDRYRMYRAEEDTVRMLEYLEEALALSEGSPGVKSEWVFQHLVAGRIDTVQKAAAVEDSSVELQLLYADAYLLTGERENAEKHLERARLLFAENPDSLYEPAIAVRSGEAEWNRYLGLRYRGEWLPEDDFRQAFHRTRTGAVRRAIGERNWIYLEKYGGLLLRQQLHDRYFDSYLNLVHYLGLRSRFAAAQLWIERLEQTPLRPRWRERLQKEKEWIKFLRKDKLKP